MSHSEHSAHESNEEHGTVKSYVIGFILSLIFTFIPYYMVVNETVHGTSLLFAILGFAFIQMIIQITFFLHIGRGPKPNWNLFFFVSTVGIILVVIGGSIMIMTQLHYNMSVSPEDQIKKLVNDEAIYQIDGEETGACQELLVNHRITVENGQIDSSFVFAKKCDTLTFVNKDDEVLDISFGAYPERVVYAGESGIVIKSGRSKTLTLSETGTFQFYDQNNTFINGTFDIAQ